MGLVILFAIALDLLISVGVVIGAVAYAHRKRKNTCRWGWGAALVMYLIPFWDWIPAVVSHQYYCAAEGGFWIYKKPEQWIKENPRVMETLVDNSPNEQHNWPHENWRGKKIASINKRFGMLYRNHLSNPEEGELFINVWRWQYELLDKQTGEVLARQVNFTTGNDGYIGGEMHSMKFWNQSDGCISSRDKSKEFRQYLKQFRGAKK